jgi:hypothetical protein
VGKVVQRLQCVNYHDSHAHGHERHGPFTRLVGVWLGWFWLGLPGSSWLGSWYAVGAKPMFMVLDLATGGMSVSSVGLATDGMPVNSVGLAVSSVGFGYRWVACECWTVCLQV